MTDTYSTETFAKIISSLQLPLIVQSGIAQLEPSTKSSSNEIVQLQLHKFKTPQLCNWQLHNFYFRFINCYMCVLRLI